MKNRYVIVISLLFLSNFSYSSEDITIYHAKEVVTLDEKVASANAVSVKSDRVMAIGSLDDLIERNPDASINRQFQNDVIVPGFIEHHIHPFLSAITMNAEIISIEGWDLPNNQSIAYRDRESYIQRLSEIEENMKSDSPLITWGFHHYFHGDLSREDLDRISKDRPILVMHRSYHEFILNTPALEYFDISQEFIESLDEEARAYADFDRGHFSEQGMISVFPKLLRYLGKPEYLLSGLQLTE
ncbi:MAG: amidohydrolase, partial [Gammaproteobacteria bacterium]|nr:amidohydrolase [Gammaproteobacteria bacterium]